MDVQEYQAGDIDRLKTLIRGERDAKLRDRYRVALMAIQGSEAVEIAETLSSNRRSVQCWAYRYRDGGIAALHSPKPKGRTPHLSKDQEAAFRERMLADPRKEDGVCTLRAKQAQVILKNEFGATYTLMSVYDVMHRLGLSCLMPRPRHEKNDPAAMEAFKKSAPFLSRK